MKVLITGGTGTISSGLVQAALDQGYETYAITRGNNNSRNIEGATYIQADIWNTVNVKEKLGTEKYDVIVECLVYSVKQLEISLQNFAERCEQYVFISTAGIYNRNHAGRITEDTEFDCYEWEYTRSKIECEKYLLSYCEKHNLKYTIIRPTVTYGDYRIPFPVATRTPGWTFFQRMIDGKPMLACDNVPFSVIHISDFSRAVVELFGNEKAYNEAFHISDNNNDIYWDDVFQYASKLLGVEVNVVHVSLDVIKKSYPSIYDELKYNKSSPFLLSDKKIKSVLPDFHAEISLEMGVALCVDAMRLEYEKLNKVDDSWNDACDIALYNALKMNKVDNSEKKLLEQYFSDNKSEFRNCLIRCRIRKIKGRLSRIKHINKNLGVR